MQNYVNQDIKNALKALILCQGTAKDSGRTYYYVELHFNNGFKKRVFLNDAEEFAIGNAVEVDNVSKTFGLED